MSKKKHTRAIEFLVGFITCIILLIIALYCVPKARGEGTNFPARTGPEPASTNVNTSQWALEHGLVTDHTNQTRTP